jgi:hypothetical protein
MLAPLEVRAIVIMIQQMDAQLGAAYTAIAGADDILQAYIAEYGDELFEKLRAEAENVVEAEVVDGVDETSDQAGLDSEEPGLDTSIQEEE